MAKIRLLLLIYLFYRSEIAHVLQKARCQTSVLYFFEIVIVARTEKQELKVGSEV